MEEIIELLTLKAGAVLFNAGCNEHVLSPKSWREIWRRSVSWFSRKTQKTHSL